VKNGNIDISFQTLSTSTLEEQGHDHLGDYDGCSPPTEEVAAPVVKTMGDIVDMEFSRYDCHTTTKRGTEATIIRCAFFQYCYSSSR
jgi:hypothetical protein